MNFLVVGASGLVGSNFLRELLRQSQHTVLPTYRSFALKEGLKFNASDLYDAGFAEIRRIAQTSRIHWIINCAALTHVDYCQTHEAESYAATVKSAQNLATLAKDIGAGLLTVSSDYVFDGKSGPYKEEDLPNPLSIYGKHKLEAEEITRSVPGPHLILRVTTVYGEEERNKNFLARILQKIKNHEPVDLVVPNDQIATPTYAADIARAGILLAEDAALGGQTGTFHIAGSELLSRAEFSKMIIARFPESHIKLTERSTAELAQPAPRPLRGGLIGNKFRGRFPRFEFMTLDRYLERQRYEFVTLGL